jgi:Leucine-rich repeat (LRR) protein
MECFIIENGVEREAGLEDLFPLIIDKDGRGFRYFLRELNNWDVDLAAAIAFLDDETKEIVYRNVSPRVGGSMKKRVHDAETDYSKGYVAEQKSKLMDFFGKYDKGRDWGKLFPGQIIWKEAVPMEVKAVKLSPLESLVKRFEEALISGKLDITSYYVGGVTQDDIKNAFQDHQNDLQKIRRLEIDGKYLPAAALLFEKGKIEGLRISGKFEGELPSWIRSAPSLRSLSIDYFETKSLPDGIGDLRSLTELYLYGSNCLETLPDSIGNLTNLEDFHCSAHIKSLPDSIGNLKNLRKLDLHFSLIEKMPDSLGDLQSLTELSLEGYRCLKALPDSIGNLKNLQFLFIRETLMEKLPDSFGGLQSLERISLSHNKRLKTLPDSIGNLKNLVYFDISYTAIEKLPDTIVNCAALEHLNFFGTKINSFPDFIKTIKYFKDNTVYEIFPELTSRQGNSISYRCFCDTYCRLVKTILAYNDKAHREGLLALEEEIGYASEDFFTIGMRLVVDGTDAGIIRDVLQIILERENEYYRKKLMKVALEGIIKVQGGDSSLVIAFLLASLVNMENNPLADACAKYLSGDINALDDIDFQAAMEDEEEREEVRFIKRAMELTEKARREGLLALEEHVDRKGVDARDIFEYGIVLVIDDWDHDDIRKILDNLISHETDPVRRNLSQAKKEAVLSIQYGDNPRVLLIKLCAFFDEDIAAEVRDYLDD